MYICDKCGRLCSEEDLPTKEEDFGIPTDVGWKSMSATFIADCSCGGEFVEADTCNICGEYKSVDDLVSGMCNDCLQSKATLENAIKIGCDNKESVEINGFLHDYFSDGEIEKILFDKIKEDSFIKVIKKFKEYCLYDKTYFAEFLNEDK